MSFIGLSQTNHRARSIEIELSKDYDILLKRTEKEINSSLTDMPKAKRGWGLIEEDPEVNAD